MAGIDVPYPLLLTTSLLIGAFTSYLAQGRGRGAVTWFAIGFFFGALGLLVLLCLPKYEEEEEGLDIFSDTADRDTQSERGSVPEAGERGIVDQTPSTNRTGEEWYYLDAEHKQYGPIGKDSLLKLKVEGKLTERTYLWQKGWDEWRRWKEVEEAGDL